MTEAELDRLAILSGQSKEEIRWQLSRPSYPFNLINREPQTEEKDKDDAINQEK